MTPILARSWAENISAERQRMEVQDTPYFKVVRFHSLGESSVEDDKARKVPHQTHTVVLRANEPYSLHLMFPANYPARNAPHRP